jgi:ribonuclease HI
MGWHTFVRYAEVTLDTVTEAHLLPGRTSAQKAELTALMQVLQLAAGVWVNIYTDSKYTFTTLHIHGALCKERRLINSGGKSAKYGQEILEFLEAV